MAIALHCDNCNHTFLNSFPEKPYCCPACGDHTGKVATCYPLTDRCNNIIRPETIVRLKQLGLLPPEAQPFANCEAVDAVFRPRLSPDVTGHQLSSWVGETEPPGGNNATDHGCCL